MILSDLNDPTLLYEYKDDADHITVFENHTYRWIQTGDGNIQSAMNKALPCQPVLPYLPAILSALLFAETPASCLVVGLGGGELIRYINHYLPQSKLAAIENNTVMADIFNEYFSTQQTCFDLFKHDICDFTHNPCEKLHDIIFVDVFGNNNLPTCFYQPSLYQHLSRLITDEGVLAINLAVRSEREALELLKLIRESFQRRTLCLSVDQHMNLVVLAFKQIPQTIRLSKLQTIASRLSATMDIDFIDQLNNIITTNPNDGILLPIV